MSNKTSWVCILLVALALRVAAAVWWQSRLPPGERFYFEDSASYWELGRAIATGRPYAYPTDEFRVFRTPGYPLLLSPLFVVWNEPPVLAARILGAVVGTLTVALVGWWSTLLFEPSAGRVAGWIAALYPGAVSMSVFVLSEAAFCALMVIQLALWAQSWRASNEKRQVALALAGGLAAAAATLTRPSWLLFTPFAVLVGLAMGPSRLKQATIGGCLVAALVLGMAPWWWRNYSVTSHFVPTTLQVGVSLYDGLNPQADGASNLDAFVPRMIAEERRQPTLDLAEATFEYRVDRRASSESISWARQHPRRALELAGIKFARMWNVWPNEPGLRNVWLRLVVLATYVPLIALALVGVWRYTRRGWPSMLPWLPAVYLTLLHMIFVGSLRYREPAMVALLPLAAAVVVSSTKPSTSRSTRPLEE